MFWREGSHAESSTNLSGPFICLTIPISCAYSGYCFIKEQYWGEGITWEAVSRTSLRVLTQGREIFEYQRHSRKILLYAVFPETPEGHVLVVGLIN